MDCPHSAWFDYDATNQDLRELFDISSNEETATETHLRELSWSRVQLDANMSLATRRSILSQRDKALDKAHAREWELKKALESLNEAYDTLDHGAEAAREAGRPPDGVWRTALGGEDEVMSLTERQLAVKSLLEKEIEKMQDLGKVAFDE